MNQNDWWYFVGFLLGDGWLTIKHYTVGIGSTDRHIVYDLVEILGWKCAITHQKKVGRKDSYWAKVANKQLWDELRSLGVPLSKSKNHDWVVLVPREFTYDYLRGFLDSDGDMRRGGTLRFLSSSKQQLENIKTFVSEEGILIGNPSVRPKETIFVVEFGKQTGRVLLDRMYKNDRIALYRKKQKALQLTERMLNGAYLEVDEEISSK